jgi:hypothetical protein
MATKYKNIVGTGFDQYVQDQLIKRSEIGENNSSRSKYLPYLTNRNAWFRLSSSSEMTEVLNPPKKEKRGNTMGPLTKEYYDNLDKRNEEKRDEYNASFESKVAKANILQGGIVSTSSKNNTILRKGFKETYFKGTPGEKVTDDLGLQPMPGITGITIGTGGKWQTLMQADIEFICYNLDQLNIMSKLYMSLGVTCFLEWGHIPYLNNKKTLVNNPKNIDFFSFLKNKNGKQALIKEVTKQRKDTDGNYDAFLGTVYNFSYEGDKNGAYLCKTQLMGAGGMVESLKINSAYNVDFTHPTWNNDAEKYTSTLDNALYAMKEMLGENLNKDYSAVPLIGKNRFTETHFEKHGKTNFFDTERTAAVQNQRAAPVNIAKRKDSWGELLQRVYGTGTYSPCTFIQEDNSIKGRLQWNKGFNPAKYGNAHQMITGRALIDSTGDLCDNLAPLDIDFFAGYAGPWNNEDEDLYFNSYITLGHLLALINQLGIFVESFTNNIEDSNSISPVLYIDYHPDNTIIDAGPIVASINPNKCLVPFIDNWGYEGYFDPLNINSTEENDTTGYVEHNLAREDIEINRINKTYPPSEILFRNEEDCTSGIKIMNVLINLDFARKTLKTSTNSDGDVSVIAYINKILDGVNESLGGVNNLRTFVDECGMILRIIDEKLLKPIEKPEDPRLLTINTFGTNSITYDSSFSSAITPKLASQIVIATQAASSNGIKDFSEEVLSYQKLNQNVKDRFAPWKFPPVKSAAQLKSEASQKENEKISKLKTLARLYKQIYYTYAKHNEGNTSNSKCEALTNTYRSLQNRKVKQDNSKSSEKNKNNSSVLIPLEYSITLDGIAGILPYNAFKIPNNRLPKNYQGRVAFAVFSINHSFEDNNWYTTLRGQTILLDIDKKSVTPTYERPYNIPFLNDESQDEEVYKSTNYPRKNFDTIVTTPKDTTYTSKDSPKDTIVKDSTPYNEGKTPVFVNDNVINSRDIDLTVPFTAFEENEEIVGGKPTDIFKPYEDRTYKDGNLTTSTLRIGFGSETITRGGGFKKVAKGDLITKKEAYADLERLLKNVTKPYVVSKLKAGGVDYYKLDIKMQVVILDIAYNYGGNHKTLYNQFVSAIKKGKQGLIDELIRRKNMGGGQVPSRREAEINYLRG